MGFGKKSDSVQEEKKDIFKPSTPKDVRRYARHAREHEEAKKLEKEELRTKYGKLKLTLDTNTPIKNIKRKALAREFRKIREERRVAYLTDKKKDRRWTPKHLVYESWHPPKIADTNFVYDLQSALANFSWKELARLVNAAAGRIVVTKDFTEAFHFAHNLIHQAMGITVDKAGKFFQLPDRDEVLEMWKVEVVERSLKMSKRQKLRASQVDDEDEEGEEEEEEETEDEDDEDEEEEAPPKKKKKKSADDDEDDADEDEEETSPKKKKKVKDEDEEDEEEEAPPKKKKKKVKDEDEDEEDSPEEEEDDEDDEPKPKKRKKKTASDDDEGEDGDDSPPKKKFGKGKPVAKAKKKVKAEKEKPAKTKREPKPKVGKLSDTSVIKRTSKQREKGGPKSKLLELVTKKGVTLKKLLVAAEEAELPAAKVKKWIPMMVSWGFLTVE
jgi:hypothetical protein